MCGKFTAMASWAQVVVFSQPLTVDRHEGATSPVTLKVVGNINVIVWDEQEQRRESAQSQQCLIPVG